MLIFIFDFLQSRNEPKQDEFVWDEKQLCKVPNPWTKQNDSYRAIRCTRRNFKPNRSSTEKTHFVELFYYFHFSFDIDYSFYVVFETNVLLWSRSPKPKWYVKLFSSLNFKWLTTTHRCVLLKFYKMLFLFVFFTYQQKYCFNTKQNTK